MSNFNNLSPLGWSPWFAAHLDPAAPLTPARVVAVDRELYLVLDHHGPFRARLSGSLRHRLRSVEEVPCVGDWVTVERDPTGDSSTIGAILPRRTLLCRKAAGAQGEAQLIAANIDCAMIVQSCHYDFNLHRLERYLVMVAASGAAACIVLTKSDLLTADEVAELHDTIRRAGITAPLLSLSNLTETGIAELQERLQPGLTYCFVGSSGVGKSTLINRLLGREMLETRGVSGTGEGRHTTVRRELIILESGALVIDNPGMREFGILGAESGLDDSFSDIANLASGCRYRNCSHANEPGCAVREAIDSGRISRERYDNYLTLRAESEFYQMSYAEKRKKDRDFGKFIKSVKKDLEN